MDSLCFHLKKSNFFCRRSRFLLSAFPTQKNLIMRMPPKLAQRLILFLTLVLISVGIISGYLQVRTQESQLLNTIINGADQLSNGITSATWHAMLANNREAAYQIMHTIALRQGIANIRIFNREGRIMFSTDSTVSGVVERSSKECAVCHSTPTPQVNINPPDRSRIFTNDFGKRELAMVTPIYNEPACSNAACHAHPAEVKVLGVLDVTYSLENIDQIVATIQRRAILTTTITVVVIGIFIFFFMRTTVHKPIAKLIAGTRALSAMQLDRPVDINADGEIGELAHSFNSMRVQLMKTVNELNELTQSLETKVQQRTEQLKVMNQKLFQSDRLASLGQLAASVAHEINNPIAGVLNLSMLIERIMKDDGIPQERVEEVRRYLLQISSETTRVGRIVGDLLAFSRRPSPQRMSADLNAIIHRTISIIDHKLKLAGVELELRLDDHLPEIKCDSSQIQQVIVNLVMNASEATHNRGSGKVSVRTAVDADGTMVHLEVKDNGDGIPKENLAKIFDPFFTTKGEGKGVGLGLAVVYGIVESHGGDIEVESKIGEGTTFLVDLPISGEAKEPSPQTSGIS
ncbi:MAG: HAMP domain-containing protein [Ignavibacteriae bacterium]|nr:MAG: HAMP domain-containing protein [Ignavibacteriota bacterium]